jgi:lipoprotein-anchoring transpeptidase ErfK/SrfK
VTVLVGILAVVVLAVVISVVATHAAGGASAAPPPAQQNAGAKAAVAAPEPTSKAPVPPLTVRSISPSNGSHGVTPDAELTVHYSMPLTAAPPAPTLSPSVAGTWTHSGSTLTFTPAGGWLPWGTERVTVPAGATATVDGTKVASTSATSTTFHIEAGSQTRLEQLLAGLHYLPFTFDRTATTDTPEPTAVSTYPLAGSLAWTWATVPSTLRALWQPGKANVMDKGAVMAFESDHGMTMDGVAGPKVWSALLTAATHHQADSHPYSYLVASESSPETLKVYRDGKVVYSTPANTGVPGATTEPGTYPVYLRYASTTMSGTNVDGSKYVDHGIPWVAYFNGGDAVHGFVRPSYGFPQSNGCVELPISNASRVWSMDPYGTLVTVTA